MQPSKIQSQTGNKCHWGSLRIARRYRYLNRCKRHWGISVLGDRIKVCNVTLLVSIQAVLLIYFLFSFHHASKAKIHSKTNMNFWSYTMYSHVKDSLQSCEEVYLDVLNWSSASVITSIKPEVLKGLLICRIQVYECHTLPRSGYHSKFSPSSVAKNGKKPWSYISDSTWLN